VRRLRRCRTASRRGGTPSSPPACRGRSRACPPRWRRRTRVPDRSVPEFSAGRLSLAPLPGPVRLEASTVILARVHVHQYIRLGIDDVREPRVNAIHHVAGRAALAEREKLLRHLATAEDRMAALHVVRRHEDLLQRILLRAVRLDDTVD